MPETICTGPHIHSSGANPGPHINAAFQRAIMAGLITLAGAGTAQAALPGIVGAVGDFPDFFTAPQLKTAAQQACGDPFTAYNDDHFIYASFDGETAVRLPLAELETYYDTDRQLLAFPLDADQVPCFR